MKISDRQLDRLRLGELDAAEAKELMAQLEAAGELSRLDELMSDADAYLERYPSRPAAQQIRDAARRRQREPRTSRPALSPVGVLSLTALAVVALFAIWHTFAPPAAVQPAKIRTSAPTAPRDVETIDHLFDRAEQLEARGERANAVALYERLTEEFEPEANGDKYLQALVRAALYHHAKSNHDAAIAAFERTVETHDALADAGLELTTGVDAAAEAQFMLAERAVMRMVSADLGAEKEIDLKELILTKTKSGQAAQRELEKVLDYQRPRWSIAAHTRIGMMYEEFAQSIRRAHIPDRLTAAQRENYRGVLEQSALQVETNAIASLRKAIELAEVAGIASPDSTQARFALKQLERRRDDAKIEKKIEQKEEQPDPAPPTAVPDDLYQQALKALIAGKYQEAAALGERAIDAGCTNKCYRVVGMAKHKLGARADACKWLQKAGSDLPSGLQCD